MEYFKCKMRVWLLVLFCLSQGIVGKVYGQGFSVKVTVNGNEIYTSTGTTLDISDHIYLGDNLEWEITTPDGSQPYFEGLPGTAAVPLSENPQLVCNPSINPGDFKHDWFPVYASVHWRMAADFPNEALYDAMQEEYVTLYEYEDDGSYKQRYDNFTKDGSTYSWTYRAQRRMHKTSAYYIPPYDFSRFYSSNGKTQHKDQVEGLLDQMYGFLVEGKAGRYLMTDTDEVLCLSAPENQQYDGDQYWCGVKMVDDVEYDYWQYFDNDADIGSENIYSDFNNENGKYPTQNKTLNNWLNHANQMRADEGRINGEPDFHGYEIMDDKLYYKDKGYSTPIDGLNSEDFYYKSNNGDPSRINTNFQHPGQVRVCYKDESQVAHCITVSMDVDYPGEADHGLYGNISGTTWPLAEDKEVNYKVPALDANFVSELPNSAELKISMYRINEGTGLWSVQATEVFSKGDMSGDMIATLSVGYRYERMVVSEFRRSTSDKWTIIGAKPIQMIVYPGYDAVLGQNAKPYSSQPFGGMGNGLDLKEGKGDFIGKYLEDFRETPQGPYQYHGKLIYDTQNKKDIYYKNAPREYNVAKGQKLTIGTLSQDYHKWVIAGTDWYQGYKTLSMRMRDEDIKERLTYILYKVQDRNDPTYDPDACITLGRNNNLNGGSGFACYTAIEKTSNERFFSYTFEEKGYYLLESRFLDDTNQKVDGEISSQSRLIRINVLDFPTQTDVKDLSAQAKRAEVKVSEIEDNAIWEAFEADEAVKSYDYRIIEVEKVNSEFAYVWGPRQKINRRLSPQNSYYANYNWKTVAEDDSETALSNPDFVETWLNTWIPESTWPETWRSNWVLHHQIDNPAPFPIDHSDHGANLNIFNTEGASVILNAYSQVNWQYQLPWIAYDPHYGWRVRKQIKSVFDWSQFNDNYLFKGIHNPDVPGLTFEENIENLIHDQYTLGGSNDSDAAKNLLDLYWKLKSGRIRIVALSNLYPDGDLANEMKNIRVYNSISADDKSDLKVLDDDIVTVPDEIFMGSTELSDIRQNDELPTSGDNLVNNPSFEIVNVETPNHIEQWNSNSSVLSVGIGITGNSARIEGLDEPVYEWEPEEDAADLPPETIDSKGQISQEILVEPNTQYRLDVWGLTSDPQLAYLVGARDSRAEKTESTQVTKWNTGNTSWVRTTLNFTTGYDQTSELIFIEKFDHNYNLYVDNVSVRKIDLGESIDVYTGITSPGNTTYYVDSENGNDTNSGTSEANAWKNLGKVNASTFTSGDKILLQNEGSWVGTLHPQGSGTVGNPIVISSYGDNSKGSMPKVDGNGAVHVVYLSGQEYWEITNLDITNSAIPGSRKVGIEIENINDGKLNGIRIANNYIHEVYGNNVKDTEGSAGILVASRDGAGDGKANSGPPGWFDGVVIENNILKNIDRSGILISSDFICRAELPCNDINGESDPTIDTWAASLNVVIKYNFLENIGGDGIMTAVTKGALIEYNTLNGASMTAGDPNVGMWPFNSDDAIFQYNEVYNVHGAETTEGDPMDAQAFDIDYGTSGTIYQYNFSHDNDGGFMLSGTPDWNAGNSKNGIVRYNLSVNDATRSFQFLGTSTNIDVYNNTIVNTTGDDLLPIQIIPFDWDQELDDNSQYANNLKFRNNLFYLVGSSGKWENWDRVDGDDVIFENNLIYGGNFTDQPASTTSIIGDPLLILRGHPTAASYEWDESLGAYKVHPTNLKTLNSIYGIKEDTSPAYEAGTDIDDDLSHDLASDEIKSPPSVGAFELLVIDPGPPGGHHHHGGEHDERWVVPVAIGGSAVFGAAILYRVNEYYYKVYLRRYNQALGEEGREFEDVPREPTRFNWCCSGN
jgi:hypothetical protein